MLFVNLLVQVSLMLDNDFFCFYVFARARMCVWVRACVCERVNVVYERLGETHVREVKRCEYKFIVNLGYINACFSSECMRVCLRACLCLCLRMCAMFRFAICYF